MRKSILTRWTLVLTTVSVLAPHALADTSGTLLPTSEGTYFQWTPTTGSTHYTTVDESTCNGTTDYVRTTTIGQRDSYGLTISSIPDGSKITQIAITPCASRNNNGAGSSTMNVFYRFSGIDSADAGSYALTGTTPMTLATTSFSGLSHIKGAASTLQIGAVYSAGTKGARLSRIAAVVTYTTLAAPSSLTATTISATRIDLSWTDNSSIEDGFKIERSVDGGAFSEIATPGADVTTFSDTTVTQDHQYDYRIRAYNAGGNSAYSNAATAFTPPTAPSGLTAATISATRIDLSWSDNSNTETTFKIERSTDGGAFSQIATAAANSTTFSDTTVSANHRYDYRIRAANTGGNSAYSNTATAFTPPAAPSGLTATTISAVQINLSWTDNSGVEDGFKIERSVDGGAFSEIATRGANVTTYSDTTVSEDHQYTYRVRAYNGGGNSSYSNWATAYTPPKAPSSLTATTISTTRIDLTWVDNSSTETSFKIERSIDGGAFSQIATAGSGATFYSDTTVSANHEYSYRVRASNPGGNSGYSNTASAHTYTSAPAAPTGLTVTNSGAVLVLNWTDNATNEKNYEIERRFGTGSFGLLATYPQNYTSYVDTAVTSGITYTYRVRATNPVGASGYSNEASGTP